MKKIASGRSELNRGWAGIAGSKPPLQAEKENTMAERKGANVTKYDNGGSGDNYIAGGYIKSVEKIWTDSWDGTVVLGSNDTIKIAVIPANAKVIDVQVYWPLSTNAADSLATMLLCTASTMLVTIGSTFLGALIQDGMPKGTTTFNIGTKCTLRLDGAKVGTVVSGSTEKGLYLRVFQSNLLPLVNTTGTIKWIVRYT